MKSSFVALAALAVFATPTFAQELPQAVKARQGQFNIMALNLGILGGMARGTVDYDADAAQAAADSLVAVSMVSQPALWPEGTDSMSIDGTRAMPAIWENIDDVMAKWAGFGEAATAMAAVAGTGKDAIGPNMGALGAACKACHDTYRAPE
ncbi:c-type cytochrome [Antarctobacter heliothermus]|uniref:Cytochrome c556 n=1 Tax=Antarctobacter heliothermus TaxID=74033 RepID=A0A239AXX4_9RHOB|nr:cytochrome c [Antarctobacter heliothermus]SNR99828.1 Cytochrome c556 [Antarctobacter heliothermus]